MQFLSN